MLCLNSRLEIRDLCVRDASYIAANMREHDFREIGCLWKDWSAVSCGMAAARASIPGWSWVVLYDGQPAACYGFSYAAPFDPEHWQAWAFGTDRFKRCVPLITKHLKSIRDLVEQHCRRLQVITYTEHDIAHGWIEALGAEREGLLRSYGRNGEDFYIYAWVRK